MPTNYYGRPRRPARRQEIADEVAQELEFHLEMRTREYIARGLTPREARERALQRFGDLERVGDACRDIGRRRDTDMRRREYLGELKQDVTFALRQLAANPGFTLVAVLTLALGIGATTAIFSAVHAVVLRPLPVPAPERLVFLFNDWRGNLGNVSAGNFTDVAAEQRSFSSLSAIQYSSFNLSGGETPERIIGARVTASFFDVFGARPAIGRPFHVEEDQPGREQVAVLSHRLFTRRFGADPAIVGREIRMNGVPYAVAGVMPASFDFTADSEELWVPMAFTPERKAMHDEHFLTVVARLGGGVTRAQAQQDVDGIVTRLRQRFPREDAELAMRVEPFMDRFVGPDRERLLTLLGAVGFVLLIACGNVANLLLARGAARARELAIRAALGAGRARIVRQLLTESGVLAIVSAAAGLALAWWGTRTLVAMTPPGVPRLEQAAIDGPVLLFTLGLASASSIVFGLAPSLRAARAGVAETLKEGSRGAGGPAARDRLRAALVALEVALAVLLLVGAGLLIRSAIAAQAVRPGFEPAGVITARLALPATEYRDADLVATTYSRLAEAIAQVPGVRAAALTSGTPMAPGGGSNGLVPEGRAIGIRNAIDTRLRMVTPGYVAAIGIPIVRGRGLDAHDRRGAQKVMVLSESAAAALFPGQDAVGRRVACCEPGPDGTSPDYKVVVGIAGDVRSLGLARPPVPEFYLPIAQVPREAWDWIQRSMYIVARGEGDPESLLPALRRAVARFDPDVPLFNVRTLEQRLADSLATARFNTLMLTLLGAIGLVLSAVGIYGVIAYFVTQRTPEIGVRMALGATRADVTRLVLRQAATPVAAGVALGLAASFAATRALAAQLVGVEPTDPATLGAVVAALALTALLATVVPARRAATVDPATALHGG